MWWTLPRKLWRLVASCLRLKHSVPPLCDEIEFFIFVVLTASLYNYKKDELIIPAAISLLIHALRGIRWQLIPMYLSILVIVSGLFEDFEIRLKCLQFIMVLSAITICYQFPMIPTVLTDASSDPSAATRQGVGVQDVVLIESKSKSPFLFRAFYPTERKVSKSKTRTWAQHILVIILFIIGVFFSSFEKFQTIVLLFILFTMYSMQIYFEFIENIHITPLIPEGFPVIAGVASFSKLPAIVLTHMRLIMLNCEEDAIISNRARRVLIFYPGLCSLRNTHVSICMEAASQGFLVLALESADCTPALSVLPNGVKRKYLGFEDYYRNIHGDKTFTWSAEEEQKFRYAQMEQRSRESRVIMDFLKSPSSFVSQVHLGYTSIIDSSQHWNLSSILVSLGIKSSLSYTSNLSRSLFWKSLLNHKFDSLEPVLAGHSFGGATVLHMLMEDSEDTLAFRASYPIVSVVAHDPWTVVPLSEAVRNKRTDSITDVPLLVIYAEYFKSFEEYNIVNACKYSVLMEATDAGHHNFNEFAFAAPINTAKKSTGTRDPVPVLRDINRVTMTFLLSNLARPRNYDINGTATNFIDSHDVDRKMLEGLKDNRQPVLVELGATPNPSETTNPAEINLSEPNRLGTPISVRLPRRHYKSDSEILPIIAPCVEVARALGGFKIIKVKS